MQGYREQAHAELKWAPSERTAEVGFTLIIRGQGEGFASQENCLGLPGVSPVPRIPNESRGNGNQVWAIGGARVVILEADAGGTDNLRLITRNRHVVDTDDRRLRREVRAGVG